jgi:hypothetical protein
MQTPTLSLAARSPDLEDLIEKVRSYIHSAKSSATLRAYRTDFEDVIRFCKEHNLPYLSAIPTTVALYIADRAGCSRHTVPYLDSVPSTVDGIGYPVAYPKLY